VADFLQLVSMLREQMNATLSRSDVLRPLASLVGIIAIACVVLSYVKAPEWLLTVCGICFLGVILLYAASYIYCLFNDRDALRSEKYSLHKMAIEHGVYGDNTAGIIETPERARQDVPAIAAPKATIEGDK
jgi:hypothetical protein